MNCSMKCSAVAERCARTHAAAGWPVATVLRAFEASPGIMGGGNLRRLRSCTAALQAGRALHSCMACVERESAWPVWNTQASMASCMCPLMHHAGLLPFFLGACGSTGCWLLFRLSCNLQCRWYCRTVQVLRGLSLQLEIGLVWFVGPLLRGPRGFVPDRHCLRHVSAGPRGELTSQPSGCAVPCQLHARTTLVVPSGTSGLQPKQPCVP